MKIAAYRIPIIFDALPPLIVEKYVHRFIIFGAQ